MATPAICGDNAGADQAAPGPTSEPLPHLGSETGLFTPDSATPVCRICYGEADEESGALLMPCDCRGSIAFAHRLCLQMCLRELDSDKCKVCCGRITVRRRRAPLWQFFRRPENWNDLWRVAANTAAGTGDVVVLTLAWIYSINAVENCGLFAKLAVFTFLFLLVVTWITVEAARAFGCCRRIRALKKRFTTIELLADGAYPASIPASAAATLEEEAQDGDNQTVTEAYRPFLAST